MNKLLILIVFIILVSITINTFFPKQSTVSKVIIINSPVRENHNLHSIHIPNRQSVIKPIATRGYTQFSKIGYLSNQNTILPLYGKQTYIGSITWNYYTLSDTEHHVKIPLIVDNKDCLDYIGCKELYNDDIVYLEAYQQTFKVFIYKPDIYY